MEERQLNFNQPLLSVRRGSLMAARPEMNRRTTHDRKSTMSPLPYYKSDLKSGPVSNPGVIPFHWEQMPGRPKDENIVLKDDICQAIGPKLQPGRIANHKTVRGLSQFECSMKETKDNVTSADAYDFLSRTNPQTQDFVMGRFLPAAEAVASETPNFVSKIHSEAREELKPVKRVIEWKEEYDREDEDEFTGIDEMSANLCGLLTKYCLLNTIPGMRDHAQAMSSVRSVRTRPVYAESFSKIEKKGRTKSHRGDMRRVTHQYDSKKELLIRGKSCRRSIAPLKDGSPQLFLDKDKKFLGLQDSRATTLAAQETTSPTNPLIEKTLYVDAEQNEQCRSSVSTSSESRGRNPSVDSLQDIKSVTSCDEKQINQSTSSDTNGSSELFTSQNSSQDLNFDVKEAIQERGRLVLCPILPKSPSESWLSRTLPSMSTKNPYSNSYIGNLAFKSSPANPKQGRMLGASNLQNLVSRPNRELRPIWLYRNTNEGGN